MIITLTTDFGGVDPFVGIMKGVILTINPGAMLVDLTHDIPPRNITEAGLALEAAVSYFPEGSVHLAVVDPGVGSSRRGLVVSARCQHFVAPDNGLLTFLLSDPDRQAVQLENPAYRLPAVSRTFHGRDVFAPAAAHLSLGVPISEFGPVVTEPVRLPWSQATREGAVVVGEVIHVDHFGNLITNIRRDDIAEMGPSENLVVELGGARLWGLASHFQDRPAGSPGAVLGSTNRLEIFVSEGSAHAALRLGKGGSVRVWKG